MCGLEGVIRTMPLAIMLYDFWTRELQIMQADSQEPLSLKCLPLSLAMEHSLSLSYMCGLEGATRTMPLAIMLYDF